VVLESSQINSPDKNTRKNESIWFYREEIQVKYLELWGETQNS
jgi:hypothetical protein